MQEEIKDIYQAADAVLKIISYEGEIEDVIEYPTEFQEAYQELSRYQIIIPVEEKYLPGKNFEKAYRMGFQKYIESLAKPSLFKKFIANKPVLGVLAGAIIVTTGYLINSGKGSNSYHNRSRMNLGNGR